MTFFVQFFVQFLSLWILNTKLGHRVCMNESIKAEIVRLRKQMWKDVDLILQDTERKVARLQELAKWRR